MSKDKYLVYRNGKAEYVSKAEWQRTVKATQNKWAVIKAAEEVLKGAAAKEAKKKRGGWF